MSLSTRLLFRALFLALGIQQVTDLELTCDHLTEASEGTGLWEDLPGVEGRRCSRNCLIKNSRYSEVIKI